MNDLIIKICGISELSIAKFLIKNNITLMGMIFYPKSPRYISVKKAKYLLDKLGDSKKKIKVAGIFVNEKIETALKTAEELSLDYIQLHGDETSAYIDKLKGYSIIKAFKIGKNFKEKEFKKFKNKNIKYFLMDTLQKGKPGGTGVVFNWEKFKFIRKYPNIIISGGLNKDNIVQALDFFNPAGIDLNSGVEKCPGIKSKKKIKEILAILRRI